MQSDESEDIYDDTNYVYRRKYQLLLDRCEVIQQDNEKLINRIHQLRKLLIRCRKQKVFIIDKLDGYKDDWRNADYPLDIGINENGDFVDLIHPQHRKRALIVPKSESEGEEEVERPIKKKKRKEKTEKDPNAPKKPANPFFQYCQEQRSAVFDKMVNCGLNDPSKKDLTRQLAANWNGLSRKDKKIYYEMYSKSKERYVADMHQYKSKLNLG